MNPAGITTEKAIVNDFNALVYLLFNPTDWNEELNPCNKCSIKNTNETAYSTTRTGLTNL